MQSVAGREPFDSRYAVSLLHHGEGHARELTPPVDVNRASAALPMVAALLGTGEAGVLAQCVEQRDARLEVECQLATVDAERDALSAERRAWSEYGYLISSRLDGTQREGKGGGERRGDEIATRPRQARSRFVVRRVDKRRGDGADCARDGDWIRQRHRSDLRPPHDPFGVDHEHRRLVADAIAARDIRVGRAQNGKRERGVVEGEIAPRPRAADLEQPRAGDTTKARDEPVVRLDILGSRRIPVCTVKGEDDGRAPEIAEPTRNAIRGRDSEVRRVIAGLDRPTRGMAGGWLSINERAHGLGGF